VREFTEREVKPVVRELEYANADPAKSIDPMKKMGIFGLAIPGPWAGHTCRSSATRPSPRN
jgi:alkylation response protein AidB-like acyl-CoA dehydrogenase